jgi:putative Mg2+ transporter-C (MgtC) family protein
LYFENETINSIKMTLLSEEIIQLLLAVLVGGIIGIEREYSNKSAGFRTMILICLGSTLLTVLSLAAGSQDRIASNIITGIGFIGAGVIFKEGLTVMGITTAAAIWVTSALGMAIGSHHYTLAAAGTVITIVVLFLFEYLQAIIDRLHNVRHYRIILKKGVMQTQEIKDQIVAAGLKCRPLQEIKVDDEINFSVAIAGKAKKIERFNAYLLQAQSIKTFEC